MPAERQHEVHAVADGRPPATTMLRPPAKLMPIIPIRSVRREVVLFCQPRAASSIMSVLRAAIAYRFRSASSVVSTG